MGLRDKLMPNRKSKKEEEEGMELPEDFEPNQSEIDKAEEQKMEDFLSGKPKSIVDSSEAEPAVKVRKAPERQIEKKVEEIKDPVLPKEQELPVQTEEGVKSNLTETMTLYIDDSNFKTSLDRIKAAVESGFQINLQAMVKIDTKNVKMVESFLPYLVNNNYLVAVVGEQTEVFDDK